MKRLPANLLAFKRYHRDTLCCIAHVVLIKERVVDGSKGVFKDKQVLDDEGLVLRVCEDS